MPGIKYPGIEEFLARKRAAEAKVDPLGFYLPPFNYAIGQMLEQAINATKSFDHKVLARIACGTRNAHRSLVRSASVRTEGHRGACKNAAQPDKDMDQFRKPGRQVVLYPDHAPVK